MSLLLAALPLVAPSIQIADEKLLYELPAELPDEGFQAFVVTGSLRVVAHVQMPDGTQVLLDGEPEGDPHQFLNPPSFDPAGEHLAWSFGDRTGRDSETWRIWADGKESKKYDWAGPTVMDRKGVPIAWVGKGVEIGRDGAYEGGDYFLQQGKKKVSDKFDILGDTGPPTVLPDGKLAYIVAARRRYVVVHGRKDWGPFWWASALAVSADGKRAVWAGIGGGGDSGSRDPLAGLGTGQGFRLTRIHDGEDSWGDGYAAVGGPALGGAKGQYLAYLARKERDGKVLVVLDGGVLDGEWDDVGTPVFSPDGGQLAYTANLGRRSATAGVNFLEPKWMDGWDAWMLPTGDDGGEDQTLGVTCFLVIDGERQPGDWQRAILPQWSADGSTVAFRAKSADGWHVVANGVASEAFDTVGVPVLSTDGKRIGFGARKGRQVWWKVIDVDSEAAPPDAESATPEESS